MPILMRDWIVPSSPYLPYLLEDTFMKGGFRIVPDLATRDTKIHPLAMKQGMLVYVEEEGQYFTLDEFDLGTMNIKWGPAKFGGPIDEVAQPLVVESGVLKLAPNQVIPEGIAGQRLTFGEDGKLKWVDAHEGAKRYSTEFECPIVLNPQEEYDFELDLGKTLMLHKVIINAPEIQLTGFPTKDRSELNPYKYISDTEIPYDQGIRNDGGEFTYYRRFSFLSNMEDPVNSKIYFRFTNVSGVAAQPKVTINYLRLE
tara:strand:+ start:672 stop:1439 length:768 start_codon:yes stop_codon:yes gene_type:complete